MWTPFGLKEQAKSINLGVSNPLTWKRSITSDMTSAQSMDAELGPERVPTFSTNVRWSERIWVTMKVSARTPGLYSPAG